MIYLYHSTTITKHLLNLQHSICLYIYLSVNQIVIKHLLCARHCDMLEYSELEKTDISSAFIEFRENTHLSNTIECKIITVIELQREEHGAMRAHRRGD